MFTCEIKRPPSLHPFQLWEIKSEAEACLNTDIQERHKRLEKKPNDRQYAALGRLIESTLMVKDTPFDFNLLAPMSTDKDERKKVEDFILHCRRQNVKIGTFQDLAQSPMYGFSRTKPSETSMSQISTPSKVISSLLKPKTPDYHCYVSSQTTKESTHPSIGIYQTEGHLIGSMRGPAEFIAGTLFDEKHQALSPENTIVENFKTLSDLQKEEALQYALLSMHIHGKSNMAATANVMINWVMANEDQKMDNDLCLNILSGQMGGHHLAYVVIVSPKGQINIKKIPVGKGKVEKNLIGCYSEHQDLDIDYTPEIIKDKIYFNKNEQVYIVLLSPNLIQSGADGLNEPVENIVANTISQFHWSPIMAAMRLVEIAIQKPPLVPGMKTAWVSKVGQNPESPATIGALFTDIKGNIVAKKSAQKFLPILKSFVCGHNKTAPPFNIWITFKKAYFTHLFQDDADLETKVRLTFFDDKGHIKTEHAKRWQLLKNIDAPQYINRYSQAFFQKIKQLVYPIKNNVDPLFQQLLTNIVKDDAAFFSSSRNNHEWLLEKILDLSKLQLEGAPHELLRKELAYYIPQTTAIDDIQKNLLEKKFNLFQCLNRLETQLNMFSTGELKTISNNFYEHGLELSKFILNSPRDKQGLQLDILTDTFAHANEALIALHQSETVNTELLQEDIEKIKKNITQNKGGLPSPWLRFLGVALIFLGVCSFAAGIGCIIYTAGTSALIGTKCASYLFSAGLTLLLPAGYYVGKFFRNKHQNAMIDSKENIAHIGTEKFVRKIMELKK